MTITVRATLIAIAAPEPSQKPNFSVRGSSKVAITSVVGRKVKMLES
ncbi:hypothetical protein QFZ65_002653 [Arthrobacter sp. B3I9]|nr:hypothetical protein [Arthrobacter sp. B3I9]MDQ0850715.1 hypothetical protein [Arthrobacter sp. B3I9]